MRTTGAIKAIKRRSSVDPPGAAGVRSAMAVRAATVLKLTSRDCSSAQGIGYRGYLSLTPSSYG